MNEVGNDWSAMAGAVVPFLSAFGRGGTMAKGRHETCEKSGCGKTGWVVEHGPCSAYHSVLCTDHKIDVARDERLELVVTRWDYLSSQHKAAIHSGSAIRVTETHAELQAAWRDVRKAVLDWLATPDQAATDAPTDEK